MSLWTVFIAVTMANILKVDCQPLEHSNECYKSNGWILEPELSNLTTCHSEKCFGFFGFPGI